MALDEMKYQFSELDKHIRAYVNDSLEYTQLKGFKYSMVLITYIVKVMVLGILSLLALFVFSLYLGFTISENMGGGYKGFLIIGIVYIVLGLVFYALRHRLNRPLLRIFSDHYFDKK